MTNYFDNHFKKNIVTIHPGEYFSSKEDVLISTVLGSCISIVLFDTNACFGGMNHFLLAYDGSDKADESVLHSAGEYGEYSVELLINDMLKKGADKKNLIAKIFGGSNMFCADESKASENIGRANMCFAFSYLEKQNIPIATSDVGNVLPRKIFFEPKTSKVFLKKIIVSNNEQNSICKEESSYLDIIKKIKWSL